MLLQNSFVTASSYNSRWIIESFYRLYQCDPTHLENTMPTLTLASGSTNYTCVINIMIIIIMIIIIAFSICTEYVYLKP